MKRIRTYSYLTRNAMELLSKQIRLGRKRHKMSESELADRCGMSRSTLQRIERGDLSAEIGLVFEAATVVGIPLFDIQQLDISSQINVTGDMIKLISKSHRGTSDRYENDF